MLRKFRAALVCQWMFVSVCQYYTAVPILLVYPYIKTHMNSRGYKYPQQHRESHLSLAGKVTDLVVFGALLFFVDIEMEMEICQQKSRCTEHMLLKWT